jgi:hypothetical protein
MIVRDARRAQATRLVVEPVESLVPLDHIAIVRELRRSTGQSILAYEHVEAKLEPVLWAADAIAWAFGAGGDWRRRIEPVIGQTTWMP